MYTDFPFIIYLKAEFLEPRICESSAILDSVEQLIKLCVIYMLLSVTENSHPNRNWVILDFPPPFSLTKIFVR